MYDSTLIYLKVAARENQAMIQKKNVKNVKCLFIVVMHLASPS